MDAPSPGSSPLAPDPPPPIPVRMLCEYVYCPRLAYLEWVQGEFEDNEHVIEGRFKHRHVDRMPSVPREDADGQLTVIHQRSVMLGSDSLGLVGILD